MRPFATRLCLLCALLATVSACQQSSSGQPAYEHFSADAAMLRLQDLRPGWQQLSPEQMGQPDELLVGQKGKLVDSAIVGFVDNADADKASVRGASSVVGLLDRPANLAADADIRHLFERDPQTSDVEIVSLSVPNEGARLVRSRIANPDGSYSVSEVVMFVEGRVLASVDAVYPLGTRPVVDTTRLAQIVYERIAAQIENRAPDLDVLYTLFLDDRDELLFKRHSADLTGDGGQQTILDAIGRDCGSCHQHYIYVFEEDKLIQELTGDDPVVLLDGENRGFWLSNPVRLQGEPYCCPSQYVSKFYLWDGLRFAESVSLVCATSQVTEVGRCKAD